MSRVRPNDTKTVHYNVRIKNWRPYYSFGENPFDQPRRFSEIAFIVLDGGLIDGKPGQVVSLKLSFVDIDLARTRAPESPNRIGEMQHAKGGLEGVVIVPVASSSYIVGMLASGKVDRVFAFGTRVHPRRTDLTDIVLEGKSLDRDD